MTPSDSPLTTPGRPLEALIAEKIAEWRNNADGRNSANEAWNTGFDSALIACADELAALLQTAAPPAPTAEPKLAKLRAMMVDFKRGTQGGNQRDVATIHKTLNVVIHEIDQLSAAPPERVSEGKE